MSFFWLRLVIDNRKKIWQSTCVV
ncbi:hypothetical protein C349_06037 [Cryptococcus neoformans var. grubii Br795]|uniref:Uncharacterized protein n=1 Tax=Cryptococcus neoformans Tu259-1 TaxID=1230072 RepID=A0A854Q9D1_CRYNE|nr:hypothetical protein C353_06039 [Cryptococcus neoformans var. grubii AD1-83a]OXG12526.1 hypothetical protein C361_06393 [Cryptococcus neoformans var. grubii Tu259-1]OXG49439.1 hypothetical protein C354_05965 [Cryptococcus neoformans var. grubii MW-RSA1955]OXG53639.1 hypothetical protein C352_05964 [Cryptococcus neoformans var. grubii CHC193]OXG74139.1 hypothetical protein C350_05909 [Cryptococcus neoformans var. grubii MW-RSA36]OXG75370.1 hypothetical protein C349_06037 [Cryptococcus neofor